MKTQFGKPQFGWLILLGACLAALLTGCSSTPRTKNPTAAKSGGGYYLDDGPGSVAPADILAIPDAVPRTEPLHRYANRPYDALGTQYVPMLASGDYRQEGIASWYGRRYHDKPTASGEIYDMYGMTAAHPILPIPSYVRVTSLENGRSVIVRINDRGPFLSERLIDLSYTAAFKLGVIGKGSGRVRVESIDAASFVSPTAPVTLTAVSPSSTLPITPPTPPGVALPQRGYVVQLGAFGQPENAQKLLLRAREVLGIGTELSWVAQVGELHRVNLGPFTSELDAAGWVDKSRSALGIEAVKTSY